MNREEATGLLKEASKICDFYGAEGIMLMPPDADNTLSKGYQLHIKATIGNEHLECMKPLVQKYKLAMNYEPEKQLLVIYRPIEKEA